MRYGATFPGHSLGRIPRDELDAWAETVQSLGFDHVALADHVVGIDHERLTPTEHEAWAAEWQGPPGSKPYSHEDVFVEPFVTLAYLAARCDLELVTASLVLPQRETALVAKQAAELDYLTGGKLRLCIGTGWSSLEFGALGADFRTRGRRLDEQIEVLRRFWTEPVVDYEGEFHHIRAAGIQTLPVQQPIPLWSAGERRRALVRAGRVTDGWLPPLTVTPGPVAAASLAVIREAALEAGRDPDALGLEPTLYAAQLDDGAVHEFVAAWRKQGATHVLVNTRGKEGMTMADHLDQLHRAAHLLGIA